MYWGKAPLAVSLPVQGCCIGLEGIINPGVEPDKTRQMLISDSKKIKEKSSPDFIRLSRFDLSLLKKWHAMREAYP